MPRIRRFDHVGITVADLDMATAGKHVNAVEYVRGVAARDLPNGTVIRWPG